MKEKYTFPWKYCQQISLYTWSTQVYLGGSLHCYSGDHLKCYGKLIASFPEYLKNYKDYNSNQYYIENLKTTTKRLPKMKKRI